MDAAAKTRFSCIIFGTGFRARANKVCRWYAGGMSLRLWSSSSSLVTLSDRGRIDATREVGSFRRRREATRGEGGEDFRY